MEVLSESVGCMDNEVLREGMNAWDRENVQHKYCSENDCNNLMNDDLEFSPEVDVWIKRRDLYTQLKSIQARRRAGNRPPLSHFLRACKNNNISSPLSLSDDEIDARIAHSQQRLRELKPVAPLLRSEHLNKLLADAVARRQSKRIRRIKEIIRNEGQRRRWGSVKRCTKPRRGGAPTRIKVKGDDDAEDEIYETREEVEDHASRKLKARFKLARDAPISQGQLFDDIGYLGNTASTKAILEGTYEFPPDMCPHTRLLCKLAHEVFTRKSLEDIATFVQTDDYQYYWKRADEFIQSSYSNIHFGHYKAAARDCFLSALEAAKLNLATRSGIPLERWGSALTVLLEKEFGNIYIEKMRAICLMEADFNWLNKLVFAKRMMDQAYDAGHVPLEQYARRGTQAAHGVLCKVLFCDYIRALHIVAGLPSVDLGNCYDALQTVYLPHLTHLFTVLFAVRATVSSTMHLVKHLDL